MQDTLHARICKSVVAVSIKKNVYTEGTVVLVTPNFAYIIADSYYFRKNKDVTEVTIVLPNTKKVVLQLGRVKLFQNVACIRCFDPTPGQDSWLEELVGMDLCEQIQENDKVFTFSDNNNKKLLTPGRIILIEDKTFDHNCASDLYSCCGAPVINEAGQFVGMCTKLTDGYLTAVKAKEVAQMIDNAEKRTHTTIADTLQNLRQ
ncbi:hypothetical protein SETIT_2G121000v2 [Setaria italica]|uniref:Uncharacterized protein n=1 Tax=Setaria italica TaxID=4555 RepID=K4A0Y7_SETIT|nr:uncharacterized protein LOC101782349 [Setaria italica]RCV10556.1 hypothetical protein SETIT_2G121000v2 [Setaria italica]RCV10557.1 hypothetical protein SETIT_2G121000v2 [Setaria italica]